MLSDGLEVHTRSSQHVEGLWLHRASHIQASAGYPPGRVLDEPAMASRWVIIASTMPAMNSSITAS